MQTKNQLMMTRIRLQEQLAKSSIEEVLSKNIEIQIKFALLVLIYLMENVSDIRKKLQMEFSTPLIVLRGRSCVTQTCLTIMQLLRRETMRFAYGRPFDKLKSESEKERKIRIGRSLKLSHSVEEWTIGVIS